MNPAVEGPITLTNWSGAISRSCATMAEKSSVLGGSTTVVATSIPISPATRPKPRAFARLNPLSSARIAILATFCFAR